MKMETKKEINKTLIIVAGVFFLIGGIFIGYSLNNTQSLEEENELYEIILKINADYSEISIDSQKAESYYNEAGFFYEKANYDLVESNCRLARDYFSKESQGYKTMKSELISYDLDNKLIDLQLKILDENIAITNNMFEACEHFESASRYYDTYYNTDVSYDDFSYDMGTKEIEAMNEKIKAHDEAVEIYNQLLEDYKLELEKKIYNEGKGE